MHSTLSGREGVLTLFDEAESPRQHPSLTASTPQQRTRAVELLPGAAHSFWEVLPRNSLTSLKFLLLFQFLAFYLSMWQLISLYLAARVIPPQAKHLQSFPLCIIWPPCWVFPQANQSHFWKGQRSQPWQLSSRVFLDNGKGRALPALSPSHCLAFCFKLGRKMLKDAAKWCPLSFQSLLQPQKDLEIQITFWNTHKRHHGNRKCKS